MGRAKKIICVETGKIYNSAREAAEDVGLKQTAGIINCCKCNGKTAAGYQWKYYEEPDLPGEVWRDAKCISKGVLYDFTGRYLVSNKGRIKEVDTGTVSYGTNHGDGYLTIQIDGFHHKVHRMVATTFIPNDEPDIKTIINHKNEEEKSNNCVENLEWCTDEYNVNYGTSKERMKKTKLEKYGNQFPGINEATNVIKKKIKCVETGEIYESRVDAMNAINLSSRSYMSTVIDKSNRTAGGYHWISVKEEE